MDHTPAWLLNSFIYLSAAVIAVPLSKALGLGAIIGYLAAGMAIGPWGLGLVTNVQDILHFAEFGVVLMLFLVGLELEPKRLWSMRRPIFGWGSAQMLACALLLTGMAVLLGVGWQVALVASLGLALSSTAIALQVMAERNLMPTSSGRAAFSILLFQDVAAIPILALLPLLAVGAADTSHASVAGHPALEAARIVGVIGAIVLGGRLLLRPLFRWIARGKTPTTTKPQCSYRARAGLLPTITVRSICSTDGKHLARCSSASTNARPMPCPEHRRHEQPDQRGVVPSLRPVAALQAHDAVQGVAATSPAAWRPPVRRWT